MPPNMRELGVVKLATPCSQDWDEMAGDDRMRFCGKCRLNVYNLTALDADEARALFLEREGKPMCVRFFQRRDGTVLTRDCRRGRTPRGRVLRALGTVALAISIVAPGVAALFGTNLRRLFTTACSLPLAGDDEPHHGLNRDGSIMGKPMKSHIDPNNSY